MEGFWEYVGPDGNLYRTEFTADEMGYRPKMFNMKRTRKSRKLQLSKKKRKKYKKIKRGREK